MPARRGVVESLVPENLRWEEGFPVEETTVWSLSEKTENPRTPATRVPVGVFTENEKFADVRVLETSSRVPWYQQSPDPHLTVVLEDEVRSEEPIARAVLSGV